MKGNFATYYLMVLVLALSFSGIPYNVLHAQSYRQVIDSMISGKPAGEQLDLLDAENYRIRYQNLSYAAEICDTALIIAKKTGDKKYIAKALHSLGAIYHLAQEYSLADSLYRKSLSIHRGINDSVGKSAVYLGLGNLLHIASAYDSALYYINSALDVYFQVHDSLMLIKGYNNLAVVYYATGEYDEVVNVYTKAMAINEALGNMAAKMSLLINMGAILETQNHYDEALHKYELAIKLADSLDDKINKAMVLKNMGLVYLQTGNNQKALDVLFESLYIRDSLGLRSGQANTIILIGKAYELQGNYQRANELYIQSLKIFQENGDMPNVATALTFIGANLYEQGDYASAIEYFRTSLDVALKSDLKLEISENYKHLLFVYAALGNDDSISVYLDFYAEVKRDLIIELEVDDAIAQEQIVPETEDRTAVIPDQRADKSNPETGKNTFFIWLFASTMIIGLVVFIFTLISLFISWRRLKK